MVNLFNRLYSISFNDSYLLDKLKINSLLRYAVRVLANRILPYCLSNRKHYGLFIGERTEKIVVSLTSFPNRISKLWMVIETILSQSIKPDKVILYLSKVSIKDAFKRIALDSWREILDRTKNIIM